jgi:hypothetical protein
MVSAATFDDVARADRETAGKAIQLQGHQQSPEHCLGPSNQ